MTNRRQFLRLAGQGVAASALFPSIARALDIPAKRGSGSIGDVRHVVFLMMENRAFDHYFGTLRGVRGFGDRHPVPLASGKAVWSQSNSERELTPFHLDTKTTNAMRAPGTPHSFADAQAAWAQGRMDQWPKFKTAYSMGHFRRDDIPFQFALADAFTICDAYHCSVTTGTDPNRIVFWSGSSFDPKLRAKGVNCTDADSEPDNLRCWIEGALPEPGYKYAGSALTWPTLPEVLEAAGVSWRIYQDPNNNWTGAMHGGLAFEGFRTAKPGSPLYENGMRHWSLDHFAEQVKAATLPQVSWVLPPALWSEHPGPSSPIQGAEFTARVLDALTANPDVWAQTALFLTFDENDGLFDHAPPPAPPSFNADGTLAGKSTLDLAGEYFSDPERKHLKPDDTISGTVRPWGLGPRVPMYVISPWSKGGWVNSQVFDHTSAARFLETRFGLVVPAISPWHRAVSGDLTSAFDFATGGDRSWPTLPNAAGASTALLEHIQKPQVYPPTTPEAPYQELGVRPSRALPYSLEVDSALAPAAEAVTLAFRNAGQAGAVFHVYDRLHLDRIPRRYTVEAGKTLADAWAIGADGGRYDLWVLGPAGFLREVRGTAVDRLRVIAQYDVAGRAVRVKLANLGPRAATVEVRANAYDLSLPPRLQIAPRSEIEHAVSTAKTRDWYDFTVVADGFARRFAGRMETGEPGISDPWFLDAPADSAT